MSSIGLFQMDGGASTEPVYEIGSPVFPKITIQLDNNYYKGKQFVIEAKNTSSKNRYIQSATLNGQPLNRFWFYHSELVKGGELVLVMGPEPNMQWGIEGGLPHKYDMEPIVTSPYVTTPEKIFLNEAIVSMTCDTQGTEIYYTLDGSEPDKNSKQYKAPFTINSTTSVKMLAYKGAKVSLPATAIFKKTRLGQPINLGKLDPGLQYDYYAGTFRSVLDFEGMEPEKSGISDNFTIDPKEKEVFFGFKYKGYIKIPKDGLYTFYLASNDGSKIYLADQILIDNDGLHPAVERSKTIGLKAGIYPIVGKYFQEGGSNLLKVKWKGPGIVKEEIPASVLFH